MGAALVVGCCPGVRAAVAPLELPRGRRAWKRSGWVVRLGVALAGMRSLNTTFKRREADKAVFPSSVFSFRAMLLCL